ncbi:protein CFAP276-like [Liolophura sinensis]|uniref:protein CFAP276-like n=1 Tax=Liolophura sinensis TaxID=3198878 RepID=UPI003158B659
MDIDTSRKPYGFELYQNDNDFMGQQNSVNYPYNDPTHLAQKRDPWNRLNGKCTLASARREVYHHDPQAPRDSLDFVLKSQYDHHSEFWKPKNETLTQPETKGVDNGRMLKNRVKEIPEAKPPLNHPLRMTEQEKRESIHSINNAIESHHTQTTNRGYARKHDGGFYAS